MAPEFIHIRCLYCGRIYRTRVGICATRLAALLPVLKMIRAKCPDCQRVSMIGEAEIKLPAQPA